MIKHYLCALMVLLSLCSVVETAFSQTDIEGQWSGEISVPGQSLGIEVNFMSEDDGLIGEISIPVQGLVDRELIELALEDATISFRIPDIPGDPSFVGELAESGDLISGTFTQAGNSLPFELRRGNPAQLARAALEGFDTVIEKALTDFNLPGFAIAIVAGGEVVYAKGFGFRDIKNELPMTPNTLFAIGSTTKAMTATVLGIFVDEGKLDWDDPLRDYLPNFTLSDPLIAVRVTTRDILSHRTGLPRHDLVWYNNNKSTREELIARFAHLELTEDLRARFQYNNMMFMTAGYLAGQLNGTSWEQAVRDKLFEPLGMTRSNFSVLDSQNDSDYSLPYRENEKYEIELIPFRNIDVIGPAGSVNSSVNEMSRWLLMNLGGGRSGDLQIINESTLNEIQSPQMTTGATPGDPNVSPGTYGLGWSLDTYRGHLRVSHGGGIDGFSTSVMLFPDDDIGIVSFDNRAGGIGGTINQTAVDLLLDLKPEDHLGKALQNRKRQQAIAGEARERAGKQKIDGTQPSHELKDYAGDYFNPGYGSLAVGLNGSDLTLTFNGIVAPLEHWHYDVFSGAETDGDPTFKNVRFLFNSNLDGLIASIEARLDQAANPILFRKQPASELFDPEYLQQFVGEYAIPGVPQKVRVQLSGNELIVTIPGQPPIYLEPDLTGRFVLKQARAVSLGFEFDDDGKVSKAVLYQPGAVIDVERVAE